MIHESSISGHEDHHPFGAIDPEILCRDHYGTMVGKDLARKHLQMNRQSIEDFKAFVLEKINGGWSVEEITKDVTVRFSRGFLEFFPAEENYRLWKLLVQRTLERFGIVPHLSPLPEGRGMARGKR